MAKLSITQAAKLGGVSRSNLYKSYIDKGIISISKDEKNRPYIDTSELLRVFPVLQGDTPKENSSGHHSTLLETSVDTPVDSENTAENTAIKALKSELEQLKQQLAKAEERESWYQSQIGSLTDTMKLLEGPKQSHSWWKFWK